MYVCASKKSRNPRRRHHTPHHHHHQQFGSYFPYLHGIHNLIELYQDSVSELTSSLHLAAIRNANFSLYFDEQLYFRMSTCNITDHSKGQSPPDQVAYTIEVFQRKIQDTCPHLLVKEAEMKHITQGV